MNADFLTLALKQFIPAENIAPNLVHDKNLIRSKLWLKLSISNLRINYVDFAIILKSNIVKTVELDLKLKLKQPFARNAVMTAKQF